MKTIFINEPGLADSWLTHNGLLDILKTIDNSGELIQSKNGKSVYRLGHSNGEQPYLVKTWCGNGLKNWVRNLTRTDNSYTEYKNKQFLKKIGVPSPEIYFFGVSSSKDCNLICVQVSEFINTQRDAVQHSRELLDAENYDELRIFSEKIILLTKTLLDAGFVDPDHRMKNLMVNELGEPVKIDLEIASIMSNYRRYDQKIGRMVGTLIYSYIFAVYPHLDIAQDFSDSMIQKMNLSSRSRKYARELIDNVLAKQLAEVNIDSRITLNF